MWMVMVFSLIPVESAPVNFKENYTDRVFVQPIFLTLNKLYINKSY